MIVELNIKKKFDVQYLKISAGVRYWEDAKVDGVPDEDGGLIPCRKGDLWEPVILVDSGEIINWENGKSASVHYKVCDCGIYTLLDENRSVITEIEGYVPTIACPEGEGYGDYIIMDIDDKGVVKNWNPSFEDFESEDA